MTEKRFKHKWNKLGMQFICYDDKAELLGTFADDMGVTNIVELLNKQDEKIKELKEELKIYRKVASCSNCEYQNYDWYDDGDEFEICERGNNEQQIEYHICEEWSEL